MSCTVHLRDQRGNSLAIFARNDYDYAGCGVLWSRTKKRAVVTFDPVSGPVTWFLLIDRDGHQHSDLIGAYYDPVWSPTQDLLVYQGITSLEGRLFIVDGDGVPLAISEPLVPRLCSVCGTLPRWSPDGEKVALVVELGDVAITTDVILCVARVDGTVSHISLMRYRPKMEQTVWLDDSHLLMQSVTWKEERYFVFDDESKTVQEITSSLGLTSTLLLDGRKE